MNDQPHPERPRAEPEIIPPGRAGDPPRRPAGGARPQFRIFVAGVDPRGGRPLRMPGPFTIAAALLGGGLILALVLFLAIGALLVALPLAAVAVSGAVAFFILRGAWRRRFGKQRSVMRS